jgi:hypothetical protein
MPIPVSMRPKMWVCGHLLAEIAGSNYARGMDISLVSVEFCQVKVPVSGSPLVRRSLAWCGVSEYDRDASTMRRP